MMKNNKCPKLLYVCSALLASFSTLAAETDFVQYLQDNEKLEYASDLSQVGGALIPQFDETKKIVLISAEESGRLLSNINLGDSVLALEYLAAPGTKAGVFMQGRYELALTDDANAKAVTFTDAGGVQQRWDNEKQSLAGGAAPTADVGVSAGQWHRLDVSFRAPRYDDASRKIESALIVEASIDGKSVQRNTIVEGFTQGSLSPWETTSGPAMLQVHEGVLAVRRLDIHPADFSKLKLPAVSGGETNEASLIDFVSLGKENFQALGCKECHAVDVGDHSMKTGPNLHGLFKSVPRDREILESDSQQRFTVKADHSYLVRSIREPAVELAVAESGPKKGDTYFPVMPPYMTQTLSDNILDAIGFYLQTLNDSWNQGPVIKLVESGGPEKYDPLADDLQFLVRDSVRIQRGPMEGLSARSIHVGQPNAINYSFDPRILGIAKVWQGGFLEMSGELKNRGGGGLKTGFETREIDLGEGGVLFAPLNAAGQSIDFSFKESVFHDDESVRRSFESQEDQLELLTEINAQFLGYERLSGQPTAAPIFKYRVGKNRLNVATRVEGDGALTVTVSGDVADTQRFSVNTAVLKDIRVSEGKVDKGVWVIPAGANKVTLNAKIQVATSAWRPALNDFNYRKQPLRKVPATAGLPAGYSIENYLPPQDNFGRDQLFEALGLAVAKDGTVVVATRTAGVWRIKDGQWQLFAEGLFDSLGVQIEDDHGLQLVVGQKAELTRITDTDGDGLGDKFDTLFDAHSYHGNYHTYMHGPARGADGAYYVNLNLAHSDNAYKAGGQYMGSQGGFSGWSVRVTQDAKFELYASGLRSPAGLATAPDGALWYTENQGEFVGTSKIFVIEQGEFYGHPSGLIDLPGMMPESAEIQWDKVKDKRVAPVVLLPHNSVANAPGNPVWDTTGGKFGPYKGQMLVGDQTQSNLLRVVTERVGDVHQGAVIPFMSELASGVMRGAFLPDNSLLLGQTGRGWQAKGGHVASLQRVTWDGKTVAPAIERVNVTSTGFRVALTQPLQTSELAKVISLRSWAYRDAPDYGSPELGERDEAFEASLSDDGRVLLVDLVSREQTRVHPEQTARVYHISLAKGVFGAGSAPLNAYYTLYRFAD